ADRRRSRKSLGRRVSFAPTAHVRMFEIPEEKLTPALQGSNTFAMPDLSSQTGMAGFNLGAISTIEETSMASNESFDVSVRHSDPSESIHSSDNSFATDSRNANGQVGTPARRSSFGVKPQGFGYPNMIDDDDDDDDDDDNDMDDDAVTMELTGTVDMGAMRDYDNGSNGFINSLANSNQLATPQQQQSHLQSLFGETTTQSHASAQVPAASSSTTAPDASSGSIFSSTADANSFLNMLLQGNTTTTTTTQQSSLLDNIMSQFEPTQQLTSNSQNLAPTVDLDYTRVGDTQSESGEEADNTVYAGASGGVQQAANGDAMEEDSHDDEDDDLEDENGFEDAVTMELTGIVERRSASPEPAVSEIQQQQDKQQQQHEAMELDEPSEQEPSQSNISLTPRRTTSAATPPREQQPIAAATPATPADIANFIGSFLESNPAVVNTLAQISSQMPALLSAAATPRTPTNRSSSRNQPQGTGTTPAAGLSALIPLLNAITPRANANANANAALIAGATTTPLVFNTSTLRDKEPQLSSTAPLSESKPLTAASPLRANGTPATDRGSRRASRARRRSSQIHSAQPLGSEDTDLADLPNAADKAHVNQQLEPEQEPEPEPEAMFVLQPLPRMPAEPKIPSTAVSPASQSQQPSLAEIAKAEVVFNIFLAYHKHRLTPTLTPEAEHLSSIAAGLEPLAHKAALTARLDYCTSLAKLFEADRQVSMAADATPTDFAQTVEFFEEQNDLLLQRKEELMLRIAKAKQRCSEDAPGEDTGRLSTEIKELRAKLNEIKKERDTVASAVESLSGQIHALRASRSSSGQQMTEKRGVQNILLAINGLQLADVAEDQCEFVYDTFSKVRLDTAAEFTSLHPEIDWTAVVRDAVDSSSMSTRQYALAVMKTNASIKVLLEDIKRVKRMTFVDLSHSGGIQVRIEFFSRKR
ncbi:hypothetical protein LPJ57_007088, partial [Coemansia sp. RSA 486]